MLHPSWVTVPPSSSFVGQRILEDATEWVVCGVYMESGRERLSRVRAGSLAHEVLARREPRLLPVAGVLNSGGT